MALPETGKISHSMIMGEFDVTGQFRLSIDGAPFIGKTPNTQIKESEFRGAAAGGGYVELEYITTLNFKTAGYDAYLIAHEFDPRTDRWYAAKRGTGRWDSRSDTLKTNTTGTSIDDHLQKLAGIQSNYHLKSRTQSRIHWTPAYLGSGSTFGVVKLQPGDQNSSTNYTIYHGDGRGCYQGDDNNAMGTVACSEYMWRNNAQPLVYKQGYRIDHDGNSYRGDFAGANSNSYVIVSGKPMAYANPASSKKGVSAVCGITHPDNIVFTDNWNGSTSKPKPDPNTRGYNSSEHAHVTTDGKLIYACASPSSAVGGGSPNTTDAIIRVYDCTGTSKKLCHINTAGLAPGGQKYEMIYQNAPGAHTNNIMWDPDNDCFYIMLKRSVDKQLSVMSLSGQPSNNTSFSIIDTPLVFDRKYNTTQFGQNARHISVVSTNSNEVAIFKKKV